MREYTCDTCGATYAALPFGADCDRHGPLVCLGKVAAPARGQGGTMERKRKGRLYLDTATGATVWDPGDAAPGAPVPPDAADVAQVLRDLAAGYVTEGVAPDGRRIDVRIDVRLQVLDDGTWQVHHGDPGWDPDHRGYWGADIIDALDITGGHLLAVAEGLVDQVAEAIAAARS